MKYLMLLPFLATCYCLSAQKLSDNKQYGLTYNIYKLDSSQAKSLYQYRWKKDSTNLFTNLYSTEHTDSTFNKNNLPKGHYLFAKAKGTNIEFETFESPYFEVRSYGYNKEAWIFISDFKGSILKDALLEIKGESYTYNEDCNCYPVPALKGNGFSKITHKNHFTFITLSGFKPPKEQFKNKKNKYRNKTFSPVRILPGYIAFNQPKYHLEDTVKTKAFLVKENGKPWKKKTRFQVYDEYKNEIILSEQLAPVSEGAFVYDFAIPDSLEIDRDYLVQYRSKRNKLLKSKQFRIEDFVLGNTTFNARIVNPEFNQGESLQITLEGKDANDLPLLDATAEIKIKLKSISKYHRDTLFVPNEWYRSIVYKKLLLDVSGATTVTFPDTLFPLTNSNYSVEITMNNSENEPKKFYYNINYTGETEYYTLNMKEDSIQACYKYLGASSSDCSGFIESYYQGVLIDSKSINFPYNTKINYAADEYILKNDNQNIVARLKTPNQIHRLVYPTGKRTATDVSISLYNEIELPVSWQIFKGTKKIKGGRSSQIKFNIEDNSLDSYYIIYSFNWQGKDHVLERAFHIREKQLNVHVDQPETVFPGATVPITVTVTDYKNEAQKEVNLTAWSVNMKFDQIPNPDLPYFGLTHYELLRPFSVNHSTNATRFTEKIEKKHLEMFQLYNTPFYRFIYAQNGLGIEKEQINTTWSELLPFVYKSGKLEKIYSIYIDDEPRFISQVNKKDNYSLKLKPGNHNVKIRTYKELYEIKNLKLDASNQTFICLNADSVLSNVNVSYLNLDSIPLMSVEKDLLKSAMLVVNPTKYSDIYFEQDSMVVSVGAGKGYQIRDIDHGYYYYYGPFKKGNIKITDASNDTTYNFYFEPGYLYTFERDTSFVSQPVLYPNPFEQYRASNDAPRWNFNTRAILAPLVNLPKKDIELTRKSIIEQERNRKPKMHPLLKTRYHKGDYSSNHVGVTLVNQTGKQIMWQGMFHPLNDSLTSIRFGYSNSFNGVKSDTYSFFMVFTDSSYIEINNLELQKEGTNYFRFDQSYLQEYDQNKLNFYEKEVIRLNKPPLREFRKAPTEIKGFSTKQLASLSNQTMLSGYLLNHKGEPIDFANIFAEIAGYYKGGALTNSEGYFEIRDIPAGNYMLKIFLNSLDNYTIYNLRVAKGKNTQVWIEPDILFISEEVVYADYEQNYIQEELYDYATPLISEKGSASAVLNSYTVARSGRGIFKISAKEIEAVPTLMGEADIINTLSVVPGVAGVKNQKQYKISKDYYEMNSNSSRIRSTFRNYGFWQPNLITNKEGKVHFEVQYPDNITQWKTIVPAMDAHKNTGIGFAQTKSFKPLSANLGLPKFLIQNDTVIIKGKVLNYTNEKIKMNTYFDLNGKKISSKELSVENYGLDQYKLNIPDIGISKITFGLDKGDGYIDGERRDLNVFVNGVKSSKLTFIHLDKDTTFSLYPNQDLSGRSIFITNDPFDLIKKELANLKNYEYGCNEQTASKIRALLLEKKFLSNLEETFEDEKLLNKLIRKIEKNQNDNGSWGWWDKSTGDNWVSSYVTETMNLVVASGYRTKSHMKGAAYLTSILNKQNVTDKLNTLNVLAGIPYPMDYKKEIAKLETLNLSLQDKFALFKLKQTQDMEIDMDAVTSSFDNDKYGIYWGESVFNVKVNKMQTSMLAYDILKNAEQNEDLLKQIRSYFLNYKVNSRNTIEQASMLQHFLEDMLMESNLQNALIPALEINGKDMGESYPIELDFESTDTISISKKGAPIKVFSYEHEIENNPKTKQERFNISSKFLVEGKEVQTLKEGQPVQLEIDVVVQDNSEYVLVEIPIPSSCVYGGAIPIKQRYEEYRQQHFEKTSIACRRLPRGRHTFTVNLIPRFSGNFSLLPASVSLMYFPEIADYTEGKRINVEE